MALESFNAYYSYLETMELLDDAECGRLFRALLVYSMTGSAPQLCGNERFVFPGMRAQIDRDKTKYSAKCEKNRANVQQRWNTSGEEAVPSDTNEYDRTETYTNGTKDKDKDKGKDKDKDNDRDKGEDRDKDRDKDFSKDKGEGKDTDAYAPVRETAGRFRAPSLGEIEAYCEESGVWIDAQAFTDYYAARGWTVGAEPMRDWRAAVRNWQRRDRERSARIPGPAGNSGFPAGYVQPPSPRAAPTPPVREHHDDFERLERILAGLAADQAAKEGAS